jgi:DNA-binding MarR family transcriptional regulator
MILEEALKTSKFRNEQHKLLIHLWYTRSVMMIEHKRLFRAWGITPEQYNILRILVGQQGQPLALHDLTARMVDPASNTSRLVEKLRQKGYLVRSESPEDRRRVDVLITDEGAQLVRDVDPGLKALESHFESTITEEEARMMNGALNRFHQSLESREREGSNGFGPKKPIN